MEIKGHLLRKLAVEDFDAGKGTLTIRTEARKDHRGLTRPDKVLQLDTDTVSAVRVLVAGRSGESLFPLYDSSKFSA